MAFFLSEVVFHLIKKKKNKGQENITGFKWDLNFSGVCEIATLKYLYIGEGSAHYLCPLK